ncbi:hypothetical protein MWU65_17650, partial [Cellulophaga sp. F20128]|uniref:hypothetical protein n=1 Tax=Cellulophaga sp. F20128 TaxID=2926413 RepID=UPI001FF47D68
ATIETTAPDAPTVVITEDTNNDGTINSSELSDDINVTISLPTDASAGDILTVNGTPHTLTAAEITAEEYPTTFTSPGEGSTLTVTATITNGVGNTSASASDAATIETTA